MREKSQDLVGEVLGALQMETPSIEKHGGLQFFRCTNAEACNYAPLAEVDNGTCVLIGDFLDDGNPETLNDMIDENCLCSGEVDDVNEVDLSEHLELALILRPTPCGLPSTSALGGIRILDSQGRVWMNRRSNEMVLRLDISHLPPGMYFFESSSGQDSSMSRFIVQRN